ncbi:MAG: polysaccharide export protein [Burkholderiales bacterium]|nr:polysaccharide export protein [Burkholderiales bacterium]
MLRIYVLLAVFFFGIQSGVQASDTGLSNYRLGSGDRISITVFDEKELSLEKIRLSDAGTVSYPMLGEIKVLGLTVSQLEKLVTDRLKGRYLVDPQVSVSIDEYRQFYVNGMVKNPGGFHYQPGLTIRQAVSLAGGFQDRADRDKITVIHDNENAPHKEKIDNSVEPGDTITIEESFF